MQTARVQPPGLVEPGALPVSQAQTWPEPWPDPQEVALSAQPITLLEARVELPADLAREIPDPLGASFSVEHLGAPTTQSIAMLYDNAVDRLAWLYRKGPVQSATAILGAIEAMFGLDVAKDTLVKVLRDLRQRLKDLTGPDDTLNPRDQPAVRELVAAIRAATLALQVRLHVNLQRTLDANEGGFDLTDASKRRRRELAKTLAAEMRRLEALGEDGESARQMLSTAVRAVAETDLLDPADPDLKLKLGEQHTIMRDRLVEAQNLLPHF